MTPRDWNDLASVFRAGAAECYRDRFGERAKAYEAMADKCEAIAKERNTIRPEDGEL